MPVTCYIIRKLVTFKSATYHQLQLPMKKVLRAGPWKKANGACRFFVLMFLPGMAVGQQPKPHFFNYTYKDGLSANCVNSICKDRYGYMWFATNDGLNKFDGANFSVYKHNSADSTTIGGNDIAILYKDRRGNLWAGTNQSLSQYNSEKDAFVNYHFTGNSAIRGLCEDYTGDIWAGGYTGLFRLSPASGKIREYRHAAGAAKTKQLSSNTVLCIYEDHRQRLWIGTNAGLDLYERRQDNFLAYHHSDADTNSIADDVVRSITEDSIGNVWFGTNHGLSELGRDGKSFVNYGRNNADKGSLHCNHIYSVRTDKAGQPWVGTEEGLEIFDPRSGRGQVILSDPRDKYSLVGNSVRAVFIDGNGLYWIGTYNGGISKYDENLAFFNFRGSNPFDRAGLSSPIVTSFAEDQSGDIYIGTDGGGLNLYHRRTGLFEHPMLAKGEENRKMSILDMEKVGDELWVGTYRKGVYALNMKSGKVRHYLAGPGEGNLSGNDIFCIKKDSKGNVWIGTNGYGVDVYLAGSGKFGHPGRSVPGQDTGVMSKGFIRDIDEDKAGKIWIASSGGGIVVFDPGTGTAKILSHNNGNLPSNVVLSLHLDRDGNMWAGSMGGGLSLFDPGKNKFTSYSEQEGLSNAVIYKILEDGSGRLWVSTNKGISSFDRGNHRFKNYSYQNGIQRSNFSLGAGLNTTAGDMFFGGMEGLNYFDPLVLHCNKSVPTLQFTALKIANRTVIPGPAEPIKEHISDAKEIRLGFKENFSIDFIALNFTTPQDCRYAYKLEGFDKDWNLVGNSHTAIYTNLDPGEYVFRARATSDDGSWITPEKMVRITVKPPFWRTGYAYAGYVLMTVLLLGLLRYTGIRRLKNKFALEQERIHARQMIEQERKEAERQHEFDELKIKFLTNLSHEFRTPVSLIVGPIERLLSQEESEEEPEKGSREASENGSRERSENGSRQRIENGSQQGSENGSRERSENGSRERSENGSRQGIEKGSVSRSGERRAQLSMVKRNAYRILNLVNQLLDFRKLEENELNLNLTDGDIVSFTRDIAESFRDIAAAKQIEFAFSSSLDEVYTRYDPDKIDRVLLNLLSNAFKFTDKGGKIGLHVDRQAGTDLVRISISDTGIGMTKEIQDKIFGRFFQANGNGNMLNQGSGIGLSIAKEFVKLHGGTISVESTEGKGSVFTVRLPCLPVAGPVSGSVAGPVAGLLLGSETAPATGLVIRPELRGSADNGGSGSGSRSTPTKTEPSFQNMTVLLIEDDDDFRQYLRDNLAPWYRIVEATNGKEGWQKTLSSHPQVIVSDINMPYMDGITLSLKIKSDKRTRHIPVILLTAVRGDGNQLRGLQTGACDYLTKPFNFEILNIKIRNLISLNQNLKNTYTRQLRVMPAAAVLGSEDEQLLIRITQYIDSHMDSQDLSVEDLSKHLFMSRGSLYNKIVDLTGEAPVEFIRSLKLAKAALLLEGSDMRIAQVGYAVGFSSPNYFAKAFKAKFNISPSEYAQQKRGFESSGKREDSLH
jgi:signal transduction histidine kinase/ligand-binding sensor domain-containing protein/DNA-binding response OmpR family regulator